MSLSVLKLRRSFTCGVFALWGYGRLFNGSSASIWLQADPFIYSSETSWLATLHHFREPSGRVCLGRPLPPGTQPQTTNLIGASLVPLTAAMLTAETWDKSDLGGEPRGALSAKPLNQSAAVGKAPKSWNNDASAVFKGELIKTQIRGLARVLRLACTVFTLTGWVKRKKRRKLGPFLCGTKPRFTSGTSDGHSLGDFFHLALRCHVYILSGFVLDDFSSYQKQETLILQRADQHLVAIRPDLVAAKIKCVCELLEPQCTNDMSWIWADKVKHIATTVPSSTTRLIKTQPS